MTKKYNYRKTHSFVFERGDKVTLTDHFKALLSLGVYPGFFDNKEIYTVVDVIFPSDNYQTIELDNDGIHYYVHAELLKYFQEKIKSGFTIDLDY